MLCIVIIYVHFYVVLPKSWEFNLEKVPGLDGTKITDIAAGAEHSVIVTGKM